MKKDKLLHFIFLGMVILVSLTPVIANAAITQDQEPSEVDYDSIRELIISIINWLLGFAALAATGFLILGGYKWMSSRGNPSDVEDGKQIVTGAIIGLLMIILAAVIVNTIIGLFGGGESAEQSSMLFITSCFV